MGKELLNYREKWTNKMAHLKDRLSLTTLQQSGCVSNHVPTSAIDQRRAQAVSVQLYRVLRMEKGYFNNADRYAFVGIADDGSIAVELGDADNNGDEVRTAVLRNGTIYTGIISPTGTIKKYDGDGDDNNHLLLLAVLQVIKDPEFESYYKEVADYLSVPETDDFWDNIEKEGSFVVNLCALSQNIYYREKEGDISFSQRKLTQRDLEKTLIARSIVGSPRHFLMRDQVSPNQVQGSVFKIYALREDIPDEMIPKMPEWYLTPRWVLTTCQDIKESAIFPQKYRNVLLKGPSGTGKTKGAQAMASCLGLPYRKVTCSPDSEIFDFIGQMLPNTSKYRNGETTQEIFKKLDIPSFEDVENDYAGTYEKLFGERPGRLSSASDCYNEIMRRALSFESKEEADFVYVESDLIRAIRNGEFCEIQEPTVIKRSSVLVGLNALFENDPETSFYTLPTGEVIRRHPDAVIVMTTNSDYEGCNNIQQSVLSRMDIVREIENPTALDLTDRIMKQTGYDDKARTLVMADMILTINDYCEKNDITDGVCGPREMSNWLKKALLLAKRQESPIGDEHILEAAFSTLIPKVSQTKDDAEDVVTACLQIKWSQDAVKEARDRYEEGLI